MKRPPDRQYYPGKSRRASRALAVTLAGVFACQLLGAPPTAARTNTAKIAAPAPNLAPARPEETVPVNHWTYDAMTQLAFRGLWLGVSDNTFSGKRALTRGDFARAIHHLALSPSLLRQLGVRSHRYDSAALRRLAEFFEPELVAEGVDLQLVERAQTELARLARDPAPTGLSYPWPSLHLPDAFALATAPRDVEFERGVALAAAEWDQGLVLLYSLGRTPGEGDRFPNAIPYVALRDTPGAAQRVLGHNHELWRRLRASGPPRATAVSWLSEVFDLKRAWRSGSRARRADLDREVSVAPDGCCQLRWRFAPEFASFLMVEGLGGRIELVPPPGVGSWRSEKGTELQWGPPGSGVVYLRGQVEGKKRIYAYDLRTGWLLNAGEG